MVRPHCGKLCPKCNQLGSGLHERWVLNGQKVRYEPYYYFAHSTPKGVHWCYIRKAVVQAMWARQRLKKKHRDKKKS